MAMKALVPVLPLAPEASLRVSLIPRSRSIKNEGQEGFSSSSFIMRLLIEMSLWRKPALRKDSWPSMQPSSALSRAAREPAL